jgi:hypothetical protein
MSIRSESRTKFEHQGVFLTRLNLQMGNMDGPEQQEAISWLAEEDRNARWRDTVRYRLMLGFTIIAAVGAIIAAWPVVRDCLPK